MVFLSGLFSGDCGIDRIAEDVQFRMERRRREDENSAMRWLSFSPRRTLSRSVIYMFCLPFLTLLKLEAELGVSFATIWLAHFFGSS
jgi:hypothetical protein